MQRKFPLSGPGEPPARPSPMAATAAAELHPLLLKQATAAGAAREHLLALTPPVVALLEQVSRT